MALLPAAPAHVLFGLGPPLCPPWHASKSWWLDTLLQGLQDLRAAPGCRCWVLASTAEPRCSDRPQATLARQLVRLQLESRHKSLLQGLCWPCLLQMQSPILIGKGVNEVILSQDLQHRRLRLRVGQPYNTLDVLSMKSGKDSS